MTELTETFKAGQQVRWTGLSGRFDKPVVIVRGYVSYLTIFGESPADGRQVYDIRDPQIGTVFAIPAGQLHAEET
jgi:hypothetical protein